MESNPDDSKQIRHQGIDNSGHILKRIIGKLAHRHIIALGKVLGAAAYFLDLPHRRIVRRNLQFTHPDWTREKIDNLARRVFQNLGISFLETFQLATLSREQVLGRVRVVGLENLQNALKSKSGLILVSAHLGSWETGLLFFCCYIQKPILGVAKKIRLAPLNRWVHRLRSRFGLKIVYKKGALPEMRRVLRRGGVIGLLVDQSRRSEGVDVNFFGQRVTTTPAAAFLAIRCQSPVLPLFCVRDDRGRLNVIVKSPLEMKRTGDLRSDIQSNTQMITDVVEKAVRQYPDQWFWVHKRWKKYYPDLYPEYQARRKRRHEKKRASQPDAGE
ncbi:lysophospholipid acyltransferase family protein [Thermodesulfobacteriota bacterium]